MKPDAHHLLRVYTDMAATRDGQPYWQVLLHRAKAMGLPNGAVLQVLEGFGPEWAVHGGKAVDLEPGRHVVVEISDTKPALEAFRDTLEITDDTGLITLEAVAVVGYGGHRHIHAKS